MNLSITIFDLFSKTENNQPVIYLVARSNISNHRVILKIKDFFPHFFVETKDKKLDKIQNLTKNSLELHNWVLNEDFNNSVKEKILYLRGKKIQVCQIKGRNPQQVPQIKEIFSKSGFMCFEYDIPFVHRFLIDSEIRCTEPIEILSKKDDLSSPIEISYNNISTQFIQPSSSLNTASILLASIDIETGNTNDISFQELISNKESYVIAISVSSGWITNGILEEITTKSFILTKKTGKDEKNLFLDFLNYLNILDPDIVTTFNGDSFDFDYLIYRLRKYNMKFSLGFNQNLIKSEIDNKYRMPGKAFVDLFPKSWSIHTKSGRKRLIDIAEYYFQETEPEKLLKLNISELPGELWNLGNFSRLTSYVEQDTIITLELAEKMLMSDLAVAKVNGAPISDVLLSTGRVNGEFELIRILTRQNTLIPPKPKKAQIAENKKKRKEHPHQGGQVITPKTSNANNVIIADFVSMYPTLMSSMNIGSESFIDHENFKTEPVTTLALLQKGIIEKRLKIKRLLKNRSELNVTQRTSIENQQKALKLVANSMYGATLYIRGRFFDIEVCNAITKLARKLMNQLFTLTKDFGEKKNITIKVIYSDTDSVFIQLIPNENISDEHILEWLQINQKLLLNYLNKNVPYGMELELEDIAKRIIFQKMANKGDELRKKAYAYYSLLSNKLIIKGFEAIRSDLSDFTKKTQENIFYILLNEDHPTEKISRYLRQKIKYLRSKSDENKLLSLLTISGIIRRPPKEYKSITPAVGAYLHYCKHFSYDPDIHYLNFSRFPYAITTKGKKKDQIYKKARHPELIKSQGYKLDRSFYISEILRIAEKFDLPNPMLLKTRLLDYYF